MNLDKTDLDVARSAFDAWNRLHPFQCHCDVCWARVQLRFLGRYRFVKGATQADRFVDVRRAVLAAREAKEE